MNQKFLKMDNNKIKGIWFFGLSGSGKSYASKYLFKNIKNSFIIDGDDVRKYISLDLDYDLKSREIQINRIMGIATLVINNKLFPIISSVYMNKKLSYQLTKKGISLYLIERDLTSIYNSHPTYIKNINNIVGKDIFYENFNYQIIQNDGKNFCKNLIKLID